MAMDGDNDGCSTEQTVGPPIVVAAGGKSGRVFDYPPVTAIGFTVLDALDRMPAPMSNVPGCFRPPGTAAIPWTVPVNCRFTSSPIDGYIVLLQQPPLRHERQQLPVSPGLRGGLAD